MKFGEFEVRYERRVAEDETCVLSGVSRELRIMTSEKSQYDSVKQFHKAAQILRGRLSKLLPFESDPFFLVAPGASSPF